MNSLLFLGDLHLGVRRIEHTTAHSRKALAETVYQQALKVTRAWGGTGKDWLIQLGDVFDRFSNPETVLYQANELIQYWAATLAGNHDLSNDRDHLGSFALLNAVSASDCVMALPDYTEPRFETFSVSLGRTAVQLYLVPYAPTQALFEATLDLAKAHAENVPAPRILCVHSNVDLPFEAGETTLNLTTSRAQALLETFQFIFCGHEHTPRRFLDGRLIVTGNLFPTRFDELDDKYIWEYTEQGAIKAHKVWDWKTHTLATSAADLPQSLPDSVQFLDLEGCLLRTELPALARQIARFWKDSPALLAVRLGVDILGAQAPAPSRFDSALDLKAAIARWLQGTGLEGTWTELSSEEI